MTTPYPDTPASAAGYPAMGWPTDPAVPGAAPAPDAAAHTAPEEVADDTAEGADVLGALSDPANEEILDRLRPRPEHE